MSEDEGFLGRWSRRKRAAAAGRLVAEAGAAPPAGAAPGPAAPPITPSAAPSLASPAAPPQAEPEFDPASLPPVETLTARSDITAFLRPQVPAALRNAALRRVWTLDPVIRDYVGPADYAWDYNAPDGVPGFALELGGDVKRLLAQAIGLAEEAPAPRTKPGEAEAGDGPAAPAQAALAEALPPPPEPVPATLPPSGVTPPGEALPPPAPPVTATAPPQEAFQGAPLPPRRHGGARPA